MPYFNVSYTESNPYDNNPGWTDGSTMSGIFFLNGISLGINRTQTQYDNKLTAPGGQYVTWSAPFDLSTDRYALYTNSYLQGISAQKRNGESDLYVVPFPICFESSNLTGVTSSDIQALKSLFVKQQGIASPIDNGTVSSIITDPNESFTNILRCYSDPNLNSYANEYLITSTYGSYEYLAIWKNKLSVVIDFGWEASIGRTFHNNPVDGIINNISTEKSISIRIFDTGQATFFSNEKYGYAQLSAAGYGPAYLRNDGSLGGDLNGKYKFSVAFWLDSAVGLPDYQVILHMVSSFDNAGNKTYRTFLKVTFDKFTDSLTIDFESQNGRGVDSITTSATTIASAPTFIQICIDTSKEDQPYNLIVYQNDNEHFHTDFSNNNGFTFENVEYFFAGVQCTTDTTDPPQATATNPSTGVRLYSFYFWLDEIINSEIAFQNYWLTNQRYS